MIIEYYSVINLTVSNDYDYSRLVLDKVTEKFI